MSDQTKGPLTPWGRQAVIARRVVVDVTKKINEGRPDNLKLPYPLVPSVGDFEEELELPMRKELIEATLNFVRKFGPYAEAIELVNELDHINREIVKRSYPGKE